ncbi:transient receptor potential cation channel subfamily A member 1 homolog isoform X2 [Lytechinus variegatus]|uniref:transient receptor potential cation channel subfamily A member 1 homolog isoform X2 n=1 Tax=Lytechinus variegatus TaxID=7654 RepID=UPI001BB2B325|nr:transient receptor potential cation channel subfamily A member 1 homolog isoform X2 [Lytechinus variegatus]
MTKNRVMEVHKAAKSGNLSEIGRILKEDGDSGKDRLNEADKKDRTPLHHASQAGHLNVVKYLIENGADINAEGDNKRLAIHFAAMTKPGKSSRREESSVILYLLTQDVDVNARDAFGLTPLHIAAMRGNKPAVFNLLSVDNININEKDKHDMTPLHVACLHGNDDIVAMLVGVGAEIQSQDSTFSSPLHAACQGGHKKIVQRLLDVCKKKGILHTMLTSSDSQNYTPLHLVVEGGFCDIVDLILAFGTDNDSQLDLLNLEGSNLDTPLHTACAGGHLHITKLLVERGALVESLNWDMATPLHHACANNHSEVVKYLIEKGADTSVRDELHFTPLLTAADGGNIETLRVLLEEGAETGNLGELELFHWTVTENKPDVLKLLLAHRSGVHVIVTDDEIAKLILPAATSGCTGIVSELIRWKKETINRKDELNNTPLHLAAASGYDMTVQEIVKAKGNVQARNSHGQMPLHLAASNGWSRTAEVLLKAKSTVDPVDGKGNTPLHLAAINGQLKIMKLLFSRDADVTFKDWESMNCLDHAIKHGHEAVAMLILNHDRWWKVLCSSRTEESTTPMRELIRKMPGVAEKVLDKCVTVVKDQRASGYEEIEFNYELIDDAFAEWMHQPIAQSDSPSPIQNKPKPFSNDGVLSHGAVPYTKHSNTLTDNHPLLIMVSSQREKLLAHPLVSSLLDHKWRTVGRKLYSVSLALYMLFLTALTGYIVVTPPRYYIKNATVTENGESYVEWYVDGEQQWTRGFSQLTLFLFGEIGPWIILGLSGINLLRELCQVVWQRQSYLNWGNFLEVSLYILAILLVLPVSGVNYNHTIMIREAWQWQCGAVAIFVAWLNFILFIRRFSTIGIYVIMFTYILRTFLKIVILLVLFLVAFALGFYSLLMNQNSFHQLEYCIMKVFTMLLGEFNYDDIFHSQDYLGTANTLEGDGEKDFFLTSVFHPELTAIMFTVMLVVMPILFGNLLVGLAVEDIHGIRMKATLHQLAMQVDLAMEVQRTLPLFMWRSAIVSKKMISTKPSRFQGVMGYIRQLNGESDFLEKATPIAKKPDKDVSIDSNLATMDNMNDLRHRLRLLEKSILELKRGGSRRYTTSRRNSYRRVTTRRRTVRPQHGATSPTGSCTPRHDGEGLKPGAGGEQELLDVEFAKMEEQQIKLKGQLDKMERMLKTLVTPEQLAAEYDDDDDD